MANIFVKKNESAAARRRVYFQCVDVTDGITPETGEAGGQPQISVDGAAWTNTGIGTLTAIGNGRYYADLTQAVCNVDDAVILTRYKSANTAEAIGDTVIIDARLERLDAAVSTRASQTSLDTLDDYVDSEVAAIKAKTDNLPASPAAVGSAMTLADGAITAAKIATDAIDADAIKADAVTKIQSGLATAAALSTVAGYVDTEIAFILDWILNKLVGTDNGDGTITYVLYADDGVTPLKTWVYTTATGTRAAAT